MAACIFGLMLWVVQALEGTSAPFSAVCFIFILLSTLAFNVCGGLSRPSGAYIFFFSTLAALIGLLSKAIFLEAADSHLQLPLLTISLYSASMLSMLLAAYLSSLMRSKMGLLERLSGSQDLKTAALGCLVMGTIIPIFTYLVLSGPVTLITPVALAARQTNPFLVFAIILEVTYLIRESHGRRSIGWITVLAGLTIFTTGGVLNFSKQAMFTPMVCWLATAASLRYRFKPYTVLLGGCMLFFLFTYMVPYSQYGRAYNKPDTPFLESVSVSVGLLLRLSEIRILYRETEASQHEQLGGGYFSDSHGLLDRLEMLSVDSELIKVTQDHGALGLHRILVYIKNIMPRVLWKNKPDLSFSNGYGQEIGVLAPEDETTSISFSPVGEAYRILKWDGVIMLIPVELFIMFLVYDSLFGDLRLSPWGIFPLVAFAHMAPEGGIAGPIYYLSYGLFSLLFGFYTIRYIIPLVTSFFIPKNLQHKTI